MKKITLLMVSIALLSLLIIPTKIYSGNVYYPKSYDVNVTSTPVILANQLVNRKYFLAVNKSTTWNVRISSWLAKPYDTGGIPLNKALDQDIAGGFYEDCYFVYYSTWYAVIDSTGDPVGTAVINVTEKE